MSIREKDKLDLELMSYTDIAYEIIKEDKKQYNTPNLFREVCNLLELSEAEFEAKIGDFFTALTTDKRFILIDSVNWGVGVVALRLYLKAQFHGLPLRDFISVVFR